MPVTLSPAEGVCFGAAVDVDEGTLLVGDPCQPVASADEDGAAYVYVRSGSGWTQQARLVTAAARQNAHFGAVLGLSGDTAAIADQYGNVTVFERGGSTWSEVTTLRSGPISFGRALDVDGERILVADEMAVIDRQRGAGAVYEYVRASGGGWLPGAVLTAEDPQSWEYFGRAVTLAGDLAVVGATGMDTAAGADVGAAYLLSRAGAQWALSARLEAPSPRTDGRFGSEVVTDGVTIVVTDQPVVPAEQEYVFASSAGAWLPRGTLVPASRYRGGDELSVALVGTAVIVGSPGDGAVGGLTDAGAGYLYRPGADGWYTQRARVTAPDPQSQGLYGTATASDGSTVAVGAEGQDGHGAVFLYAR